MKCPKCGNEQEQAEQCFSCGIYFEKYENAQKRREDLTVTHEEDKKKNGFLAPIIIVSIFFFAIILFIFDGGEPTEIKSESIVAEEEAASTVVMKKPVIDKNSINVRLNKSHPPKNPIEKARNATVFIQTEWGGSGSGFIIDKDCRVITNRHVIEFNTEKNYLEIISSVEYQSSLNQQKQIMMIEIQKLAVIYQNNISYEGVTSNSKEIKAKIKSLESDLANLPEIMKENIKSELDKEAQRFHFSSIKASLVDGSEYEIWNVTLSEKYDLATFELSGVDCPYIRSGDPEELAQGNTLYTIGNPSGLTYTVTSGVFSGFRRDGEHTFLQTDAPINPGNSGGPLVNKKGK